MCPSRVTQEGYSKCAGKTQAPEPSVAKQMCEEGRTAPCERKVCWRFKGECEGGLGCIRPAFEASALSTTQIRGGKKLPGL